MSADIIRPAAARSIREAPCTHEHKNQHPAVQDAWVDGHGGRLFARVWSPAAATGRAPIILLHDSLGSVELWRGFPAALCAATGRQVVAYDRLGFGKSDAHPGKLALGFVASEAEHDFAAVRQQLGIGRFVVFGHSVGGGMAVNCAAHCGDACVALITESAQAFVEDRTVQGIEEARELFKDAGQFERLKRYHGDRTAGCSTPGSARGCTRTSPGGPSPRPAPRAVPRPGDPRHRRRVRLAQASAADRRGVGGGARLEIMPDTRHVPHREKEAEVIELVRDFVATLG
jgi:pimeloyl-ACP methyl ester carboxylesterase